MTSMIREPMLSAKAPKGNNELLLKDMKYPKLVSPKMDGFRAFGYGSQLWSRKLKLLPNKHTQSLFAGPQFEGFDGELVVGNPWDFNLMQQTSSGVTSHDGEPAVRLFVFDDFTCNAGFEDRLAFAGERIRALSLPQLVHVKHKLVHNEAELLAYEERCVEQGYEGTMLRDPNGPYKQGRATLKEGWLIALKRRITFEAKILAVHEGESNTNEATINELGRTKRSSAKAGKVLRGTFGGCTFETREKVQFRCGAGPGVTAAYRDYLWAMRHRLPGMFMTISAVVVGTKIKPRQPQIVCLRSEIDFDAW